MIDDELTRVERLCPHCGELVEIVLEADLAGEMVYDCEVCCNPWRLTVRRERDGVRVEVRRLDG